MKRILGHWDIPLCAVCYMLYMLSCPLRFPSPPHRKDNEEARANGKPIKYMYRHLYCPEKGMFCSLPESTVNITGKYCEVSRLYSPQ